MPIVDKQRKCQNQKTRTPKLNMLSSNFDDSSSCKMDLEDCEFSDSIFNSVNLNIIVCSNQYSVPKEDAYIIEC